MPDYSLLRRNNRMRSAYANSIGELELAKREKDAKRALYWYKRKREIELAMFLCVVALFKGGSIIYYDIEAIIYCDNTVDNVLKALKKKPA